MGNILLIIVTFIYIGVAFDYCLKAQYGMGLAFLAYAFANIGFILAAKGV